MASVKNLKKDINYVLGDIIEECYVWELLNPKADKKNAEAIIDEAISSFDSLIEKVNAKKVADSKAHFKAINSEFEETANALLAKINSL
ncbi:hypothetical protein [Lutibacter sp.]|jgi:hypothetical protein|uniref:hypothetical protein n=1 Tax=Lutibacter sp. TaxID=1925666 RepID=UPI001A2CEC06|nr:hypothetical protein [Lutibacter sp.]MBI9041232.1 hypothetical protein [Lutibacter sp.]